MQTVQHNYILLQYTLRIACLCTISSAFHEFDFSFGFMIHDDDKVTQRSTESHEYLSRGQWSIHLSFQLTQVKIIDKDN